MKSSAGGTALFKMISPEWNSSGNELNPAKRPQGIAYTMDSDGKLTKQWETSGWYAYEGFISDDGRYFVSLDPHSCDQEKHTDIAVAFYDRGTLLKQYRVCDLIKDPASLSDSVIYYQWRPFKQSFSDRISNHNFCLTMIDKTRYLFDVETGDIIETQHDSYARSFTEVCEERETEAASKGLEAYEKSALNKRFQKYFKLEEASDFRGRSTYGIDFEEPEWRATFIPIEEYGHPCKIKTIFPILEPDVVHTEIMAEDIDMAFKETIAHPEFKKRFSEASIVGIEMKISGNSLHMMRYKAERDLPEAGVDLRATPLEKWAYLVVESSGREYTSIYYNVSSKQLVIIK